MLRDNSMVHERFLQVKDLYKFVPFFLQKAEFIVSRSKSRKVDLLCQLMDGMEACCNILPVLLLLCLSRKSHLGLSELPQLLAEEAEGKRHVCFISRLCVSWKRSFFLCCLLKCIFCLSCCSIGLTPGHADRTQKIPYFFTSVEVSIML